MALGIAFMIGEFFVPSYGSLGIGGIVAFVVGALMLIDTDFPGFVIPWTLIAFLALVTVAFVAVVVRMAVRARERPIVSGVTSLAGRRRRDAGRRNRHRLGEHPRRDLAGEDRRARRTRPEGARRRGRRRAAARRAGGRRLRTRLSRRIEMTLIGPGLLLLLLVVLAAARFACCANTSAASCSSSAGSGR